MGMSNRATPELLEKHHEQERARANEAIEHAVTLMEACRTHGVSRLKVAGIEIEMSAQGSALRDLPMLSMGTGAGVLGAANGAELMAKLRAAQQEARSQKETEAEPPLDPDTADLETLFHSAQ